MKKLNDVKNENNLTDIVRIINAKGDVGEIQQIIRENEAEKANEGSSPNQ